MYSEILREGESGKWNEFAEKQSKWLLEPDPEKLKKQATKYVVFILIVYPTCPAVLMCGQISSSYM